ncbi:endonuclease/exonuclease/phosphatase family protein [Porphyromonadaceae bacterium OttesenSCG-928-L07]|nr:endonuclease/exonuclease/phosphatase family protein [Porphyromonadaceae bacterium OttesenSCG-928-L07]MDL2251655.1 endonuclease/exonuclease/phosphatase family protein [Odoribacter sp. OttesenSCG-928-J03]
MLKLLDKILFLLNIFLMFGLAGTYVAQYIDPNTFGLLSLLGLAYPYLLLANVVFLIYWIYRLKKKAFIVLGVLLLGIPLFLSYYGINSPEENDSSHDFSMMSYNVRYFDKYNWSNDPQTFRQLIRYIDSFDGDFVCLQEFPGVTSTRMIQDIVRGLKSYPYSYIQEGMAVFSRLKLLNRGVIPFNEKYTSSCIYFDVKKGNDTLRVYNIHLESYKLDEEDRKFMREITSGNVDNITGSVKSLGQRMIKANRRRAKQAEQIEKHIEHSPYKVVVCGDFNDTPLSFTYHVLKRNLKDSFIEQGHGLGNTYIGEFPSFRIDYILHSPEYQTISYLRDNIVLSDHYPIIVKIKRE